MNSQNPKFNGYSIEHEISGVIKLTQWRNGVPTSLDVDECSIKMVARSLLEALPNKHDVSSQHYPLIVSAEQAARLDRILGNIIKSLPHPLSPELYRAYNDLSINLMHPVI